MRTIDADALIAKLKDEMNDMNDGIAMIYTQAAINELKHAPPVDAVEVIRCKDCTYGAQDDIGRWYCRSLGCQIGNEDGTGFCADAERRQDEAR